MANTFRRFQFACLLGSMFALLVPEVSCTARHPVGLPVLVARSKPCLSDDRREVVIQVLEHGSLKINAENVLPGNLDRRLEEILRTRAYRVVSIIGQRDVDFQSVAQVIDQAKNQADYVVIVTHLILKEVQKDPHMTTCFAAKLPKEYLRYPREK